MGSASGGWSKTAIRLGATATLFMALVHLPLAVVGAAMVVMNTPGANAVAVAHFFAFCKRRQRCLTVDGAGRRLQAMNSEPKS